MADEQHRIDPPVGDPHPNRTVFWPWLAALAAVFLIGLLLMTTFNRGNRVDTPGPEGQPAAERTEPDNIPLPNPTTRPIPD